MEMKPLSGRRRAYDRILRFLLYFCAALTCALLLFIIGYIFFKGLPHVTWQFLSTQPSFIKDTIGILPNILNTVYLVGVTLIITLPLGVGAAIYLTEYARNRRLVAAIEFATETLTGIPSIIFGHGHEPEQLFRLGGQLHPILRRLPHRGPVCVRP